MLETISIELPNGIVMEGVPAGTSKSEIQQKAIKAGLAKPQDFSTEGSIADPLGQGLTFGFADELAGAAGATIGKLLPESWGGLPSGTSWTDAYRGIRDEARGQLEDFRYRNPITSIGAEMVGGMATGAGTARALPTAATGLGRAAGLTGLGAVEGALYGAGQANTVGDIPGRMATGAGLGAGAGLIGAGLGGGINAITSRLPKNRTGAVARDVIELAGGQDEALAALRNSSVPGTTLADISPEARAYAQVLGNTRGARTVAEDFLTNRQRQMTGQVQEQLLELGGGRNFRDVARDVADRRVAQARQDFDVLRSGSTVQPGEAMTASLNTPTGKSAARKALGVMRQAARNNDLQLDDVVTDPEFWHQYQQALRSNAGRYARSGDNFMAANANRMRGEVLTELDDQLPGYGEARQKFAASMNVEEAIEQGAKDARAGIPEDEVRRTIAGLSEEGKQGYLAGLTGQVRDVTASMPDTANTAWRTVRSPSYRGKLEAAVGDSSVTDRFFDIMNQLSEQNQTFNAVLRGSRTAPMQQAGRELGEMLDSAASLASGDLFTPIRKSLDGLLKRPMTPDEAERLMRFLLNPDLGAADIQRITRPGSPNRVIGPAVSTGLIAPDWQQR